jgi:hypothetical protein
MRAVLNGDIVEKIARCVQPNGILKPVVSKLVVVEMRPVVRGADSFCFIANFLRAFTTPKCKRHVERLSTPVRT